MCKNNYLLILLLTLASVGSLFSQTIHVKGKVLQEVNAAPIPNVNILLKTTTIGTISSKKGEFNLDIPIENSNDSLCFSGIGYAQVSYSVKDFKADSLPIIYMKDSVFNIDEVLTLCYDNISGAFKKDGRTTALLLTHYSLGMPHINDYIDQLEHALGKGKAKKKYFLWRRQKIKGFEKRTKIQLYVTRTSNLRDNFKVLMVINNSSFKKEEKRDTLLKQYTAYFQNILDKTFESGINYKLLEKKKNIFYLKGSDEAYNGKIFRYYKSGAKGLRGDLIDGKKDGRWEYWYENGESRMVAHYDKGKKSGSVISRFKTGDFRIVNFYKNNRLTDYNIWWYPSGELKKIAFYKKGVLQGKIEWKKDKSLLIKTGPFDKINNKTNKKLFQNKDDYKKIIEILESIK